MTYEGILEGTPGPKMNQFVLNHLDPPEHWRSTSVAIDTPMDLTGKPALLGLLWRVCVLEGNSEPTHYIPTQLHLVYR